MRARAAERAQQGVSAHEGRDLWPPEDRGRVPRGQWHTVGRGCALGESAEGSREFLRAVDDQHGASC